MRGTLISALLAVSVALGFSQNANPNPPFVLVLSANKVTVQSGESVWLKVTLTNNSDQDLDASANFDDFTQLDPNYEFKAFDHDGNPIKKRIYEHPELAGGHPVNRTVKP